MPKIKIALFASALLILIPSLAFAEFENTEILRVSVKINDNLKDLPVRIDGPEPIFVTIYKKDVDSFADMSVYLAGETGKQFTVTSDLNDFNVIVDGGKILGKQKDKVTFLSQDSRIQIYVFGVIPQKTVMNILKVAATSDLVNVLGKMTAESETGNDPAQMSQSDSAQFPLLDKIDTIVSSSNLPQDEKNSILLKKENLQKMYENGQSAEADRLVLQLIDNYQNKTLQFQQDQLECEKSRVKISELSDKISSAKIPENLLVPIQQDLIYAKKSYEANLCKDGYLYAEKGIGQINSIDSITVFTASYPFVLPGSLISAIAVGGIIAFKKLRGGESFSGGT